MISQRSKSFSATGLGRGHVLVLAFVLTSSSCMSDQRASERSLAVKAETESDLGHAQAQAVQSFEPEYFEGDVAPAVPAALAEERTSAPSTSHVWVGGHHTRRDGQWMWVRGRWAVPPSGGAVWVPGHWVSHLHGFMWINGAWR